MRLFHRPGSIFVAILLPLVGALLAVALTNSASATGLSVTVPRTPGQSSVSWSGTAPFNNGQSGLLWGQLGVEDPTQACTPGNTTLNSQQRIAVHFPASISKRYDTVVRFSIRWHDDAGDNTTNDMAMYLFGPDGKLVAVSDGSQDSEGINVTSRTGGVYNVLVCSFQNGPAGTPYTGKVTARTVKTTGVRRANGKAPTYFQFSAPKGSSDNAGEPSIGTNWKTGRTLFTSNTDEYRVRFHPGARTSSWQLVNDDVIDPSNKISFDPIGFTDHTTGRTLISQLYLACSASAYSDDDFDTQAIPAQGCGSGINGFDHQTIGGGPFPKGLTPTSAYPHAVYYCSQGQGLLLGGATCARSDDGGITYGAPVLTWTTQCSGIHGHVQVASDGTVYLPNSNCGDHQGVAVSRDGGATWKVHTIPGSLSGTSDPYVGVGKDGTVYLSYADGTGQARVAISRDRGQTWSASRNVGAPFGIHNTEFAMAVAGDGNRAAVAFLGTPTRGSTQAASFGKSRDGKTYTGATWHMYVATTYDRGRTWHVVDSTPKDPVQRGCIWNSGGSSLCRNLLDFNAMTIDKHGRVLIGFADGCVPTSIDSSSSVSSHLTNACTVSRKVAKNGLLNHGAIIRQMSGRTLFHAYDK